MMTVARGLPAALVLSAATLTVAATPGPGEEVAGRHVSWELPDTPLDRGAEELALSTQDHLEHCRRLYDRILGVEGARTIANTLEPLNELYMHMDAARNENDLFEEVHPDPSVREAAKANVQAVSAYGTELSLDRALYEAIAAVDLSEADATTRYAVEKDLRSYRRAGVDRPDDVRERIKVLNDEIVKLGQAFSTAIREDEREITVESLAGLPADYVAGHPAGEDGLIRVDTTYPDYIPFMRYAQNGADRRRLYLEYVNRAHPQNLDNLHELIRKRDEKARLLGYAHWADYATEDKMIGSEQNAAAFIERIAELARPSARRDYELLLEAKRQDDPEADTVEDWEKAYYGERLRAARYDFDSQQLRPYFEYDRVRQGIFDLTSRLFGVRYEPARGLRLWHEDVSAWDLFDGEQHVGRFYLDMHPREDKYGHAACFGYREGIAGQRLPQSVLVCNFPNPRTTEGPALMEFAEVETFFHEFGHLLHALFAGHNRWTLNTGISNEWDFVEAPSQMLEEFLFEPEVLATFARHHETGEPVPAELVERLRKASDFGKGMNAAHQMFYAALSLACYNRDAAEIDTNALVQELQARYSPFPYVEGAHFQCNFGHLNGYSAIYYTYMWSQVIAKDMYSRFSAEGVLAPETARAYRRAVLEPGGSRPAAQLVREFLGREYGFDAFREWLERN